MFRLTLLAAALGLSAAAYGADYGLDPAARQDTVRFESTARLEFLSGVTNDIRGGFTVDPENTAAGVSGRLQVDLRTMKTGIDLRDRHMRENHLQTDEYPYAWFELNRVSGLPSRLEPGKTATATANGTFFIHGVSRPIQADLEVTRLGGGAAAGGEDAIRVRARFEIRLEDFAIERPKALFLKVAETIRLNVVFIGRPGVPPTEIVLPDWPIRE